LLYGIILFVCLLSLFIQFEQPFGVFHYPYLYLILATLLFMCKLLNPENFRFKKRVFYLAFTFIFLIILSGVISTDAGSFKLILTALLGISLSIILISLYESKENKFLKIFDLLLYLFSITLLFQFILYYLSGIYLDLHELLFPWSQGKGTLESFGFARFTGIHLEPGSHATFTTFLILLSLIVKPRVGSVHYLSLLSIGATFSTVGVIYAVFLCVVFFLMLNKNSTLKTKVYFVFGVFIVTSCLLSFGLYEYIENRFILKEGADMSFNARLNLVDFWLDSSLIDKVFGVGFGVNQCTDCLSTQSAGILFNFTYQLGIVGVVLLVVATITSFLPSKKSIPIVALFIIISVCRVPNFWALFYFSLFFVLNINNENNRI
jgi:hypothetical protein